MITQIYIVDFTDRTDYQSIPQKKHLPITQKRGKTQASHHQFALAVGKAGGTLNYILIKKVNQASPKSSTKERTSESSILLLWRRRPQGG
jgi:hypothetical protein